MWLRNIFTKTLLDLRAGAIGWGSGIAVLLIITATQYQSLTGGNGPGRQQMIQELTKAFQSFAFLIGEITDISSIGGFITVRILGFVPLMIALWAAVAGVGAIRGEEQNGSMEVLLATPHSRQAAFSSKARGVFVALGVLVLIAWLGLYVGIAAAGEAGNIGVDNMLYTLLNIYSSCAFWGALGLLFGQLTGLRRTASSATGAVLFASYLLDNLLSGSANLKWLAWLTPSHYYSVSKPLVPGRIFEWGAWSVIAALTLAAVVAANLLFTRRDVGSVFRIFPAPNRKEGYKASDNRLLNSPLSKNLRDLTTSTILWGVGIGVYAAIVLATTKSTIGPLQDVLKNVPFMAAVVGDMSTPEGFLSYSLFTFLPVLFAIYAILQVNAWAEDEEEGRMETLTTMPIARWQFLMPRYVAFALSMVGILVILGIFLWVISAATDTPIAADRTIGALLTTIPATLTIFGLGLAIATWLKRPGRTLTILSAIVALMFIMDLLGPVFKLPEAVSNLSIFHLYGKPLVEGIKWGGTTVLIVAVVVFGVLSLVGFQRRDIAK